MKKWQNQFKTLKTTFETHMYSVYTNFDDFYKEQNECECCVGTGCCFQYEGHWQDIENKQGTIVQEIRTLMAEYERIHNRLKEHTTHCDQFNGEFNQYPPQYDFGAKTLLFGEL